MHVYACCVRMEHAQGAGGGRGDLERETRLGHDEHPPSLPLTYLCRLAGYLRLRRLARGLLLLKHTSARPRTTNKRTIRLGFPAAVRWYRAARAPVDSSANPQPAPHTTARLRAASASAARLRCASSCDAQRPTHPSMQKHSQGLRVKTSVQQTHANTSDRVHYSRKRTTGAVRAGVHKAHVRTRLRK